MASIFRESLAARITRRSSAQTYFIIRFLVDRDRVQDAFQAYAYFRWVDDILDGIDSNLSSNITFAQRQRGLLESLYNGGGSLDLQPEEKLLKRLVEQDPDRGSGLYIYLDRMMSVMEFDARRRGSLVSAEELDAYQSDLAAAVTEAMHYFIGHGQYSPPGETRYLAVKAAHITHMLRDTLSDYQMGYFNIPSGILRQNRIRSSDPTDPEYREWICSRVKQARRLFSAGRSYLSQVEDPRCRLVGLAYTTRFEWVLRTIERENFCLRMEYKDRKSFRSAVWIFVNTLKSYLGVEGMRKAEIPIPAAERKVTPNE